MFLQQILIFYGENLATLLQEYGFFFTVYAYIYTMGLQPAALGPHAAREAILAAREKIWS